MTTNVNEEQLMAAAAKLVTVNPELSTERAVELARAVLTASAPATEGTLAPSRPIAPKLDRAALANMSAAEKAAAWVAHEKKLSDWLPVAQSYQEPITEDAQRARDKLAELRSQAEATTDAEKVTRAMEREKLMQVILAGGMARL